MNQEGQVGADVYSWCGTLPYKVLACAFAEGIHCKLIGGEESRWFQKKYERGIKRSHIAHHVFDKRHKLIIVAKICIDTNSNSKDIVHGENPKRGDGAIIEGFQWRW